MSASLEWNRDGRLQTKRKRVIAGRQLAILEHLLTCSEVEWFSFYKDVIELYDNVKNPSKALFRDLNRLLGLRAISSRYEGVEQDSRELILWVRLDWPSEITETEFFPKVSTFPRSKENLFMLA
jgi:hypothetical protein